MPESMRTPERCRFAADAIEAAIHLVDDRDAAEVLARLADDWRAEADRLAEAAFLTRALESGGSES